MGKKFKISILALASALLVGGAVGSSAYRANADEYTASDANYRENYRLNDVVTVDEVTFTIGEKDVKADWSIRYPSGETYKLSSFELSQVGKYTVTYRATEGKKTYTKEYSFTVESGLFGGTYTSAEYTHYDFSDVGTIQSYPYGTPNFEENKSRPIDGILCEVTPVNNLVLNQVIDVTGLTKNDTLITVHPLAQTLGNTDYEYMRIKLTDVYDDENFIYIEPHDVTDAYDYGYRLSYCQASHGYELPACLSNESYTIKKGGYYGARLPVSFHGMPNGSIADFPVTLSYDDETKQIYACGILIADLDDMNYFDTPWEGFTTGEVRISIELDRMTASSGKYIISQIYGFDDLSSASFADTEGPQITVDYGEYDEHTYPQGQVGYAYPVYEATAFDKNFGKQDVVSTVYYNYNSNYRVAVDVKDGYFYPERAGVYQIVYTSSDRLNNKSEYGVSVVVYEENANKVNALYDETQANLSLGESISATLPTVSGGYGNYTYRLELLFGNESLYESEEEFSYLPLKAGDYTVRCTVTDSIGQSAAAERVVTMTMDSPVLVIDDYTKLFPDSFVSGVEYVLPTVQAYDFAEGAYKSVPVQFSVGSYENGKYTAPYDQTEVTVTICADESGANDYVFKKPIYNVSGANNKGYDMSKFFITNSDVTTSFNTYGSSKISYLTYAFPVGTTSMTYFNKAVAHGFASTMSFPDATFNYSEIKAIFADSENEDIAIAFTIKNKKNKLYLSVNGGRENLLGDAIGDERVDELSFKFDADVNTMYFNGVYYQISTNSNGEDFFNFPSQKIYFTLNVTATDAENRIVVKSVGNQTLTSSKRDEISPVIYTTDMPVGFMDFGTVVSLGKVYASDAIAPNVKITYSFKTPSGVKVKNAEYEEGYSFKLEEYGQYIVSFYAVDEEGNKSEYLVVVSVRDMEQPQITFKGKVVQSCSVNKKVKLATLEMSDNLTATENLQCTIFIRDAQYASVVTEYTGENEYTFTKAGKYTIWYYVTDESGNATTIHYTITVK